MYQYAALIPDFLEFIFGKDIHLERIATFFYGIHNNMKPVFDLSDFDGSALDDRVDGIKGDKRQKRPEDRFCCWIDIARFEFNSSRGG